MYLRIFFFNDTKLFGTYFSFTVFYIKRFIFSCSKKNYITFFNNYIINFYQRSKCTGFCNLVVSIGLKKKKFFFTNLIIEKGSNTFKEDH